MVGSVHEHPNSGVVKLVGKKQEAAHHASKICCGEKHVESLMKLSYCPYLFQTITCSILVIPGLSLSSVVPLGFSGLLASSSLCNLILSLNSSKLPSQPKTPPTHLPILQTQNIFFPSNQKNSNLSSTLYHLHSHKKLNTQITH
ncbi:hypothetical protein GBA52_026731 [Prunus armeniaca]|nr:hypothetical protein GBA52_026731 [Prunus armeniaca]